MDQEPVLSISQETLCVPATRAYPSVFHPPGGLILSFRKTGEGRVTPEIPLISTNIFMGTPQRRGKAPGASKPNFYFYREFTSKPGLTPPPPKGAPAADQELVPAPSLENLCARTVQV